MMMRVSVRVSVRVYTRERSAIVPDRDRRRVWCVSVTQWSKSKVGEENKERKEGKGIEGREGKETKGEKKERREKRDMGTREGRIIKRNRKRCRQGIEPQVKQRGYRSWSPTHTHTYTHTHNSFFLTCCRALCTLPSSYNQLAGPV
jgi:hypothetical protein